MKTYETQGARGEFTHHGRRIAYDLEAGEHTPKTADERLVIDRLVARGVAVEKSAKKDQPKAAEKVAQAKTGA